MNKVILMGRLTRDPKVTWTQGNPSTCIARLTLAVDRKYKREGEDNADFISCVAFGKNSGIYRKVSTARNKGCWLWTYSDWQLYK